MLRNIVIGLCFTPMLLIIGIVIYQNPSMLIGAFIIASTLTGMYLFLEKSC